MYHAIEKEISKTVDLFNQFELHKIEDLGKQIATKEHLKYVGYHVDTTGKYSVTSGKVTLHFNRVAAHLN